MTPTPWVAGGTHPYKGNEGYVFDTSRPEILVCKTFGSLDENSPPLDQQLANSAAICSAVNGTYGVGISPDAVKDMRDAIANLVDWYRSSNGEGFFAILQSAEIALNKSKL